MLVAEISHMKTIQEFNKDLKDTEDELFDIFKKMSTNIHQVNFLRPYFVNSCHSQQTIVSFSENQIKTLLGVLEQYAPSLALMRPLDKDPVYKVRLCAFTPKW